tara:strand:+ start:181 stop:825 length:645 start_codon:yes stop_codon:yes gene_type:complete
MDEDISAINTNTRNTKIINFFIKNKKKIIITIIILVLIPLIFFSHQIYKSRNKELLAEKYNSAVINYKNGDKSKISEIMKEVINDKDKTFSPLALYFLIDNNVSVSNSEINKLFDIIINEINLDKEIKNLIIYKKALYNSEFASENDLLKILNPIINSDSIWKSHSLYLLGEFFISKNDNLKAKEFFEKILILENSNQKIKLETQRRIQRDFSE